MGMVIISFVVLVASLIGFFVCANSYFKNFGWKKNVAGVGCYVFGVLIVIFGACTIVFCAYVIKNDLKKDIHLQSTKNEKQLLTRMLLEDYNATNLSNAIEFNNKQKMIVVENNSFMFRYLTRYYSVDTIQIPDKKFMPTSKVIVEGLEMSPE